MAKLTDEEQAQLDALTSKRDAPDESEGGGLGRALNITIDLGDDNAVARALKFGFLKESDITPGEGDGEKESESKEGGGGKE